MKQNNSFISRLITLGASVTFHSYYAFIQDFVKVNAFITVLWGIVNLGLVYRLVISFTELKNKKNV